MFEKDLALTKEERECLRTWFRQAIAQVEIEEATAAIIRDRAFFEGNESHRTAAVPRRKATRSRAGTHARGVLV